jgi:hypothetical protein
MNKTIRRHKTALMMLLLLCTLGLEMAQGRSLTPWPEKTGAPGHGKCTECHGDSGTGNANLTFSGGAAYQVSELYSMQVTVTDPSQLRFGFSMVARDTDDNLVDVGTWSITDTAHTQVHGPANAQTHVSHKNAPYGGGAYTFEVNWTAPAVDVGEVTFYFAANAADGLNTDGPEDNVYLGEVTIAGPAGPNEPPVLSNLLRLNDGSSQFTLTGVANLVYIVEYGDDLKVWNLLKEVTLNSSAETVTDNSTLNVPFRVYRAREKVEP